jgi:hypothetical protein
LALKVGRRDLLHSGPSGFAVGSALHAPEAVIRLAPAESGGEWKFVSAVRGVQVHYSMTSSAPASSDCGMVRLSALAVFRLMTSSNLAA